jgi:FAD/FMN-containing dehydrogenase
MTHIATVDAARTAIDAGALEELRARVRGPVLEPGDPGHEDVRPVFNAMHTGTPALTIRATGTADVVDAVSFAREQGLPLAVRGGGHSIAGLSAIEGGVLLDLALMRAVLVDPDERTVVVQGGAVIGDVDRETLRYGLVAPSGVVSDTGVAGITLGGGYGWVRRKYGLALDSLVEAQVVTADGRVLTASADENADLFWALRGGGGNFGVVTAFTFALEPLGPDVAFAATFYPLEEIEQVLKRWRDYTATARDEVTSVVVAITFPANPEMPPATHDRPVAIVGGVYAGDPDEGMRIMQPLRELGTPLFDMSGPTPYTHVQSGFDPLFPRNTLRSYWKSQYIDDLTDAAIATIADRAENRPTPLTVVATFHMGGAIAAVDPEATAFSERSAPYMVSIDGNGTEQAGDDDLVAWVRAAWSAVSEHGTGGVYLNFTGLADEEDLDAGVDSALGRNLARLRQIKAKYDPDNFFRINNNIQPA